VKNIFISDKLAEVGINKQSAGSPCVRTTYRCFAAAVMRVFAGT